MSPSWRPKYLRIRGRLLEIFDSGHSDIEDRFIAIGPIERGLVVIVYTEPDADTIRIIGVRRANKREQSLYRSYMEQQR